MKNYFTHVAFLLAIAIPYSDQAITKIEDAVVGAVVTEGIKLHGFLESAPLPLLPGGWKIVGRKDYPKTWLKGRIPVPFVQFGLVSMDMKSGIALMDVSVNIETDRDGMPFYKCEKYNNTPPLFSNFKSASSQLIIR
jgi:hypothetical protein